MKKIIILIAFILLLGGCYDYTEIDDLALITSMIIDYEDNMYKITSQIIENQDKTIIKQYTTTCNTIDECVYKISENSNKDIFISHLKTLIITKNIIINNIDFYDYFLREPKSKMNFHVYYIDNKDIDNLINFYKDDDNSLYIEDLLKFNQKLYSSSTELYFLDYIKKKKEYGIEPLYPSINIKNGNIVLDTLVAFNKKDIIKLTDKDVIYYNLIINNINKTLLELPCDKGNYSLEIDYSNTSFSYKDNTLNINTNLKGTISSYNCDFKLDTKDNLKKLSDITNQYIEKGINNIIKLSKDDNTDFIGLSSYIYKHSKKKIDVNLINTKVKVNTIIESLGEIKNEL